MDKIKQFFDTLNQEQTAVLSTSSGSSVTMRVISPVLYQNKILDGGMRE